MTIKSKLATILLLASVTLGLSGCWSSLDLKNSILVLGTGIDKADNAYAVTVEVMNPSQSSGSESGSGGTESSTLLRYTSTSMHGAARGLIQVAKRRPIFTHTRVWVLGEPLAKDNVVQPLDLVQRDQMPRFTGALFIGRPSAAQVMAVPSVFKKSSAIELASAAEAMQFMSNFTIVDLRDFFEMMTRPTRTGYLPIVKIVEHPTPHLYIDGTAVIKDDKMVGSLNTKDTMGLLWILGQVKGGSVSVNYPKGKTSQIEIGGVKTTMKPQFIKQRLKITVNVRLKGTLADTPVGVQVNDKWRKTMERKVAVEVAKEIRHTMHVLQEDYDADIIRAGLCVYRGNPKQWHKIQNDWGTLFKNALVETHVTAHIYHEGMAIQTVGRQDPPKSFWRNSNNL